MFDYDRARERATRDIVVTRDVRGDAGRPHHAGAAGSTSKWAISDPTNVRRQFKGMVERCRDCGFDLAGGLVEVVPTAHYFMGGVICEVDTRPKSSACYVAGEDASGMHGANRLGGNGVANSTVFGGIAGEVMPRLHRQGPRTVARPDAQALDAEVGARCTPFQPQARRPQRTARKATRH